MQNCLGINKFILFHNMLDLTVLSINVALAVFDIFLCYQRTTVFDDVIFLFRAWRVRIVLFVTAHKVLASVFPLLRPSLISMSCIKLRYDDAKISGEFKYLTHSNEL